MSGANQKKAAAQQARLEREAAERAAADRSKRLKLLGGAVGLVVLIIAIVLAAGAFKETDGGTEDNGASETAELVKGVPVAGTLIGRPDAPVTIHEFADLKCPACQQYEVEYQQKNVEELVRTGKANLRMHLINIIDPGQGTTDGERARVAANNLVASNKFWSFVSTLYYNQGLENDEWASEKRLKEIGDIAPGVGADAINVRETPASRKLKDDAEKLAAGLKVQGTPSFFVQARGTSAYTPVEDATSGLGAAVEAAAANAKAPAAR